MLCGASKLLRAFDVGVVSLEHVAIRGGIGIWWDQEGNGDARVARVMPGGPAATSGLQAGDVVTAIDGTPVESAAEASDMARGDIGAPVTLTIHRGDNEFSGTMTRADLDVLIAKSK